MLCKLFSASYLLSSHFENTKRTKLTTTTIPINVAIPCHPKNILLSSTRIVVIKITPLNCATDLIKIDSKAG
jgi:hypothetical protein